MRKFFKWLGIVFLIFVVLPIAWTLLQDYFNRYSWHQKLTIEVETPSGLKTGSSVISVRVGTTSFVPGSTGGKGFKRLGGEATVVEVAPGRYLFALLKKQDGLAQKLFEIPGKLKDRSFKKSFSHLPSLRETRTVPMDLYPLLVTLADINDPASVKKVDPVDLEASFGAGYKLKSITLEITDEPVTSGQLEAVLGWWKEYKKNHYRLNGERCIACPVKSDNIADLIGPGLFKTGGK